MKKAIIFPKKTSFSPIGKDYYFGEPDLFTPIYDEIDISVLFTWDIDRAIILLNNGKITQKK